MDCEKDLSKLCKPLFVKLTRISNLDINKWKQGMKYMDRPYSRRRILSAWQSGDCRYLQSQKIRNIRKRATRCISSDSDDELLESHVYGNEDNILTSNRYKDDSETDMAVHEIQSELLDVAILLPKNNVPIDDKFAWKYKRKRARTSQSFDIIVQNNDDDGESKKNLESNNINCSNDGRETAHVDLSKEIKIVSSRLEDSDDPQVERWRSKKKTSLSPKSKPRLPPKLNSLDCTVCSVVFDSKEQLSNHIFKHTQRELQEAYKAAKTKLRENENNGDIGKNSEDEIEGCCNIALGRYDQSLNIESPARKQMAQTTPTVSTMNTLATASSPVPMIICSCHNEHHPQNDASVQIEMVLFCETCRVLFRRSECFETHYRFSTICNADRTKGRIPKLFCSTCRVILNTLSNMRRHLEEHASINFHGTVTFVCNICRVVFFGVGTVFCTHWFNHEKDPTFVASRYSFPKLCVSTQGTKPSGSTPDEQYFFVAEYVCRSCKFQFSSECELTDHIAKDCEGPVTVKGHVQSKSAKVKPIMTNLGSSKLRSETSVSKNDSAPLKPSDMINKWICEFCDEFYSSRSAFDEHSSKHLQDDGYPGYSCVFQLNASTAFICNVCQSVHNTIQDLMNHWVTHEVIKFICTVCNEKCSSYNSFEAHISLACWKSRPDCRVWFNRQQHSCKICKSMYKTAEELAHHYAFHHVTEKDSNITVISHTALRSIAETSPASQPSTNPRIEDNHLNEQVTVNSSIANDNQTVSMNSILQHSAVTADSQTVVSHIENSVSGKLPLQELSTIKITIPNLMEQSSILCQAQSIINPLTSSNSTHNKTLSGICELRSASSSINLSNGVNMKRDTPGSAIITKTLESQSMNLCEATINITVKDACSHGSNTINTSNVNLDDGIDDNARLKQTNIGGLHLLQSMATASLNSGSIITSSSSNDISMEGNKSKLRSENDALAIINEPKSMNDVSINTDRELGISECDEPEIIEIPKNSILTSNTLEEIQTLGEPELKSIENCELKCSLVNNSSSSNVRPLQQMAAPNNENDHPSAIESADRMDLCSIDSDASKPRGFLRVKKFTELQAVRNYICNLCGAAFDNVMSLDEHVVAHGRRSTENEKHPTMMAALILPHVDSGTVRKGAIMPSTLSIIPQMAGKRTLPHIPQRVANSNGRKANPLARGQTSNKSHNLPIIHNSPNIQNVQEQPCYTCPLCLMVFRCEDFSNHMAANHTNICVPATNTNSNSPNIPYIVMNATSKEERRVYTCKICKYTTCDRETINKHVGIYHLSQFQQNTNIVAPNSSKPVQQIDLTLSASDRLNPNTVPPFKCSLCTNYQYNTIEELAQHFQTVHHSIIRKDIYHPYVCHICFHPFQTYSELIIHTNSHQNTGWT